MKEESLRGPERESLMLRIMKKENFDTNGHTLLFCVFWQSLKVSFEGVIISKLEARIFPNIDGGA